MTLATAAAPSSAQVHHAGHTVTRAISRLIALLAPMLAMASVTPTPAAADGPVFRQSADTLSVTLTAPTGGTVELERVGHGGHHVRTPPQHLDAVAPVPPSPCRAGGT